MTMTLTMARAATNPSNEVAAACTTSVGVNAEQPVTFKVSGPDSVEAGSTATFQIDGVQVTLPAEQSGFGIDSYQDIQTRVDVYGATPTGAAITVPGTNLGSGAVTATVSGTTVLITIPGPIVGGTTITTPTVAVTATVTAAAGAATGLKPATPFYQLTAKAGGLTVATTCNPEDAAAAANGTLTVPVSGTDSAPPSITITAPYAGAIYGFGQVVTAAYSCSDPAGVVTCDGTVAKGAAVDTATEGAKTFTVSAADSRGNSTTKSVDYLVLPPGVPPPAAPAYMPLNPGRLLDTRTGGATVDGIAVGAGATTNGQTIELQVAGRHGVPDDAVAAVLNVTAADTAGWGFVTVYPCGEALPVTSNLNYTEAGDTRPNAVVTKIGEGGKVCLTTDQAGAQLLADLDGYFPAGAAYTSLNPGRLLDTRSGGSTIDGVAVGAGATTSGQTIELQVAGRHGVPDDAGAVALNVTATDTQGWGYVTAYPCGEPRPVASNLNYTEAGQTTPNAVITKIGEGGKVCLTTDQAGAQLLADVDGYFPAGAAYTSLNPGRLLDTRTGGSTIDGQGAGIGAPTAGQTIELQVGGRHGVPADALAAVLNVTATATDGWGYVTVWPCGDTKPNASNLNYVDTDQTRPNAVITEIGAGGKVCLAGEPATTDLLADVDGYFPKPSGPVVPSFDPPPTDPTTPTTPPTTTPGDTTPPPAGEAPPQCAGYPNQLTAQAAFVVLTVLGILDPNARAAAAALDPNGNGVVCEDYPF